MAKLSLRPTSARRLDAYRVALELVAVVHPLIARIAQHDPDLACQLKRALPSAVQNLAEAMRRTGRDRAHLLTVALGSTDEVRSIVDVVHVQGLIEAEPAAAADAVADRLCAMLYRIRQRLA
jgi:four helix bundle protein